MPTNSSLIPAGRKGEEACRRGSQIAHPVFVGCDELVALVVGELADAQGRLEGHESDVDPEAIEQRESRFEIVRFEVDLG